MKWQETLLKKCEQILLIGGEVKIQFHKRYPNKVIPIIRVYPDNQIICDEEIIVEED